MICAKYYLIQHIANTVEPV